MDNKDTFSKKLSDLYCERIDINENEITLKCYQSFSKTELVASAGININIGNVSFTYINPKYRFQKFGKQLCDEIEKSFGNKLERSPCGTLSTY